MKSIPMTSARYVVSRVLRKSSARYAAGIVEGDVLEFRLNLQSTTGASSGLYSLAVEIIVNGEVKATCSQNEAVKIFDSESMWAKPIFELELIS